MDILRLVTVRPNESVRVFGTPALKMEFIAVYTRDIYLTILNHLADYNIMESHDIYQINLITKHIQQENLR